MEEAALRAHQSSFLRLKRKLFVLRPVCLLMKHGYLCFSLPPKIDIIVWTSFLIIKIQTEVALP